MHRQGATGRGCTASRVALAAGVQQRMEEYVDVLCAEIRAHQPLGSTPLRTVYFGGGVGSAFIPLSPATARLLWFPLCMPVSSLAFSLQVRSAQMCPASSR